MMRTRLFFATVLFCSAASAQVVTRDLMADPTFTAEVARYFGLTPMRFFDRSGDEQMEMNLQYLNVQRTTQEASRGRTSPGAVRPSSDGEIRAETYRAMRDDPNLLSKVAAHNGMTPMRFADQSDDQILQMVQDYVCEKMAKSAGRTGNRALPKNSAKEGP